MNIRKVKLQNAKDIRSLIIRSVKPEVNPDFDEEGVKLFYQPNEIPEIRKRILNDEYLTLSFNEENKIIGLITLYKDNKLDQLFVDPAYRKMQISKQLWNDARDICIKNNSKGEFWVKSSTMAIPVYESFGFKLTTGRQQKNGITYYPMVLKKSN